MVSDLTNSEAFLTVPGMLAGPWARQWTWKQGRLRLPAARGRAPHAPRMESL